MYAGPRMVSQRDATVSVIGWILPILWVVLWTLIRPVAGGAIEAFPTHAQIDAALARGKAAAVARIPPDRLYAWFGSVRELEPRGFLMTKLTGLTVMSAHFALRAEFPTAGDIGQVLGDPTLLVSVSILGDRPDFAVDSYLLLVQGDRIIKPVKVRSDGQASRTSVWPAAPAYRAKVVASFLYADFDPRARTKVSVYPAGGGEVSFDLNLAEIE